MNLIAPAPASTRVTSFGESLVDPCPDNAAHRDESLYVESSRVEGRM